MIIGRRWGLFWDKLPFANKLFTLTNFIPHPQNYKYIILGGHGLGLAAFKHYLDFIYAKPCEVFSYEIIRPFVFWRKFNGFSKHSCDGLILDKFPINTYVPSVFKTLDKKVPLYQLIRDPISVIKSNINVTMFHAISLLHSQKDADRMLFEVIDNISHLMFYFTSQRLLVEHITSEVHYLRMRDIGEDGMPQTLESFVRKFGYQIPDFQELSRAHCVSDNINRGGDNTHSQALNNPRYSRHFYKDCFSQINSLQESVIKGSLFPRCFPYVFKYEKRLFVVSTPSRFNGYSIQEVDMRQITQKRLPVKIYYPIKTLSVKEYQEYPLILASLEPIPSLLSPSYLQGLELKVSAYFDYVFKCLETHKKYQFDEDKILATLLADKPYAKELAHKIDSELTILKRDIPLILDEFIHTKKFLSYFDLV